MPETDPPCRQITIGFGCFLELLRQAAANKGARLEVTPFPEDEPQPVLDGRPVAAVRFVDDETATPDPLFAAAVTRRTNRAPFRATPVDAGAFEKILAASIDGVVASGVREGARVGELRALAKDAWEIEWALDRTRRESIAVTRIGAAKIDAEPWGLSLAGPLIEAASLAGAITRENMDASGKTAYEQSIDFYNKAINSASAFVWTSTATNTRSDQLAAGRAWVRMQQAATLDGVAFHPLSQALQEFPEMGPAYDRAHELMAHQEGATVQMLARIGFQMREHRTALANCRKCPAMIGPVVSGSPVLSPILLIGQAPGDKEGGFGKPFAWTAGKTIVQMVRTDRSRRRYFSKSRLYGRRVPLLSGQKPKGSGSRPEFGRNRQLCRLAAGRNRSG